MNKNQLIRIATRESPLAIWQAEFVKQALLQHHPHLQIELLGLTTEADQRLTTSLAKIGGKGLFVKELEEALLDGRADLAVHSMKDVPAELPTGLGIVAICERENPFDAFVSNQYATLQALPKGAVVGTSSLRRQCLLLAQRPDLKVKVLRGNVATRLRKLDENEYDAIILAAAGLIRLQLQDRIREYLTLPNFIPAVGQGALAIECRLDNPTIINLVKAIDHFPTRQCVLAERTMNQVLEGGCQVPIAGYAVLQDEQLSLVGMVGQPDGSVMLRQERTGPIADAEKIGAEVAKKLLKLGADKILRSIYQ